MSETKPDNTMHPLKHVAIIMDGNNRWAEQRALNSLSGHKAGVEKSEMFWPVPKHMVWTVSVCLHLAVKIGFDPKLKFEA